MPRLNMPVVVSAFNDPTWGLILVYADGRMARQLPASKMWVAMDGPDYAALWPAPAPEAPIADQAEVRYGALDWQPGLWRCGCGFLLATTKKSCTTCGEVSPALRPEPTP